TPCDDKDIELALGRYLQVLEGTDNLQKALDIFTRLRTRAAGGQADTPCDDKDIELGIAAILISMMEWRKFDELQLEKQLFSGFETSLCLSLRNFHEVTVVKGTMPEHTALLGKAFYWAALAVEGSGGINASCLSQLAH
ncbi:hypothetical protein, partial [Sansalvadorimonas verongulae]|uniref:hypothetical protein n=1 Tax=Sansalvadorimonas verongulae TaxID=2172824 RepID=UPI0018AD2EB7